MWKFQGWNWCDLHVRIGVIDLVREGIELNVKLKRVKMYIYINAIYK